MLRLGRGLFLLLAGGLALLLLLTLGRLPALVASHFDVSGTPNGWSSRTGYGALLLLVGAIVPLGVVALVGGLTRAGPQLLNIPSREYWRRPEHADEAVRRVRAYVWWLACIMAATGLAVHWLVLRANALQPPRLATAGIVAVLAGVLVAVSAWAMGWYRVLRPPAMG
jgi:uncharacterized membrane protein